MNVLTREYIRETLLGAAALRESDACSLAPTSASAAPVILDMVVGAETRSADVARCLLDAAGACAHLSHVSRVDVFFAGRGRNA
jgi:hypothetical protein